MSQESKGLFANAEDHRGQGHVLCRPLSRKDSVLDAVDMDLWLSGLSTIALTAESTPPPNPRDLTLVWGSLDSITDYWEGERDKGMAISGQIWTFLRGQSNSWAPGCGWSWMTAQFFPLSNYAFFPSFPQIEILRVPFNTHPMSYTPMQRWPPGKPDCGKDTFICHLTSGWVSKFSGPGIKWKCRTLSLKSINFKMARQGIKPSVGLSKCRAWVMTQPCPRHTTSPV